MLFLSGWSIYMAKMISAMAEFYLEMRWKTSQLHTNVTANLWRNGCSLLLSFVFPSLLLHRRNSHINNPLFFFNFFSYFLSSPDIFHYQFLPYSFLNFYHLKLILCIDLKWFFVTFYVIFMTQFRFLFVTFLIIAIMNSR